MQDLPAVPDELTTPELVGHRVKNPRVQQPEQRTDDHERHRVARNLRDRQCTKKQRQCAGLGEQTSQMHRHCTVSHVSL